MSLINDALKRASQQQKKSNPSQPFNPGTGGAAMTPAATGGPSNHGLQIVLLLIVLAVCVLAPTWLVMRYRSTKSKEAQAAAALAVAEAQARTSPPTHTIVVNTNLVIRPGATNAPKPTPPSGPTPPTKSPPVVAQSKPPTRPEAKLPPAPRVAIQPTITPTNTETTAAPPRLANTAPTLPSPPPVHAVWPTLKLQGIFFRLNNPTVLLNGQTARVGDTIDGVKVLAINRLDVKVGFQGETNTLPMP